MASRENTNDAMFIHSKCCNAHWELTIKKDGTAVLLCEHCGKPAGKQVTVKVDINTKNMKCDCCGDSNDSSGTGD